MTAAEATLSLGTREYREVNEEIKGLVAAGTKHIELADVYGQRYLGCALPSDVEIDIHGTPGNDMGAYMDGAHLEVYGNGQDQIANTMNEGSIVVHGHCGDAVGYAMRGGEVFVRDYVGWRVGIHMKQYREKRPVIVIGGDAGAFLGEYMAGGVIILMGKPGRYLGSGMHGGVMYLKGGVAESELSLGLVQKECDADDDALLTSYIGRYNQCFDTKLAYKPGDFTKIVPASSRPYGNMYVAV
jgi:glutamate synthase domain-containing protein 3